jgi:DNA replication initiation complex subunit (GINS family)
VEIDVGSLGELLRKERASPYLQPVEEDFYRELGKLLKEVNEKYPPHSRERDNLQNLVTDIFNSREKKLVLFAVSYARSGENEDVDNATPDEKKFLKSLVNSLRERRKLLLQDKESRVFKEKKTDKTEPKEKPDKEKNSTVILRILEDLPPIVGSDGKTYGLFKPEDIVALPERNAKVFIKHKYGEPLDIDP